jgi:hypothetical protein
MSFLVLAYPEFTKSDYQRIQSYRKENDAVHYNIVDPHFTLVFPFSGWESERLIVPAHTSTPID